MLHCIPTPCQSTSLSTMRHLVTQNCRFAYCITLSFCYLCSNKFRHASRRTAYQGGTFALYGFMEYTKQPIDYPQQIQMMKERGLMFNSTQLLKTIDMRNFSLTFVISFSFRQRVNVTLFFQFVIVKQVALSVAIA